MISNEVFEKAITNKDNMLIMDSASRPFKRHIPPDEIYTCKIEGLWQALENWDEKRIDRNAFTSYLYQRVKWLCLKYLNDREKLSNKKKKYLNHVTNNKNCTEKITFTDDKFEEMIDGIPENYKKILRNKYIDNMTLKEIGDKYGYTHEMARKNIQKAIDMIRPQWI